MSYYQDSKVFAQLLGEDEKKLHTTKKEANVSRQIDLHETGEASLAPDVIRCTLTCSNVKDSVEDVKQSVTRRLDYVLQTLRNNSVKDKQRTVHKLLSTTEDGLYQMKAEVVVDFQDANTYEKTVNFLVEKLEKSIKISKPVFMHSSGKLSSLRRQACLNAVQNCRTKATAIAQLLNQNLGSPLLITEEDTIEYTGNGMSNVNKEINSFQEHIENNTYTVSVKVHVVFECKERTKNSRHK